MPDGRLNWADGVLGASRFEAAVFAAYDRRTHLATPARRPPDHATDAVYAAARMFCANGAQRGADISGAVFAYHHASWYVTEALALTQPYGQTQA